MKIFVQAMSLMTMPLPQLRYPKRSLCLERGLTYRVVAVEKMIHSRTKRPLTVRRLSVIDKKTDATIEGIINCAQYH